MNRSISIQPSSACRPACAQFSPAAARRSRTLKSTMRAGWLSSKRRTISGARLELLKAVKYKSDKVEVWRALAGIDERTKATSLFLDLRRIVELDPKDLEFAE